MFTGSGHEPHYFPEAYNSPGSAKPVKKRTISYVAGAGCTVAGFLWIMSVVVTDLKFFGDTTAPTAQELRDSRRFLWAAFGALVVTVLLTVVTAQRAHVGLAEGIGRAVVGVIGVPAALIAAALLLWR